MQCVDGHRGMLRMRVLLPPGVLPLPIVHNDDEDCGGDGGDDEDVL